jgi:PIN domain nuclease of toxin-antitoxin system
LKYLLDTSVWLRGYFEPDTVPERIRRILTGTGSRFGVSAISLWEIGKKHQLGKLPLDRELAAWFQRALGDDVEVLPITPEIVVDAMHLPTFPNRDPADELIVATSRVHRLTLLTTDERLRGYEHARIDHFPARRAPARATHPRA